METLPEELRTFLQSQPFLELTDEKRIKCTLNGHELPCNLPVVQKYISSKRFKKLSNNAEFNYSQYEPHLVPSTKQPKQLFCKLTLRHINRIPDHVLLHINGKRYKKALAEYEECVKQGVKFVPARLRQKNKRQNTDDGMECASDKDRKKKQDSEFWAPSSSEGEGSDTDSMSDLYPPSMFTLKKPEEQEEMEKDDDDFQTDDDDDDEMEISKKEDEKHTQKRKKVQFAGFNKKLKKNRKRKSFKAICKVNNGKK